MRARRTLCAFMIIVGALPLVFRPAAATPSGFVTRDGTRLLVDGELWRAVGVNMWDLDPGKARSNDFTGCYYQHPDLDAYFDASFRRISQDMHATVVRTFGFREYYTAGGSDYSSTDKLLYYAQKYNLRVIPVLGEQFSLCGVKGRGLDWYNCPIDCTPGYKRPTIWGPSYREQTIDIVRRYKDNPTIAFWQLVSEPLYAVKGQEADANALIPFVRDMVTAIHDEAGDTNHLINAGTVQGVLSNQLMTGLLLDCPEDGFGGCADLAESHDFGGAELNGAPFPSWVMGVSLSISNSYDSDITTHPVPPKIDGWIQVASSARHNGHPDLYWSILLGAPASKPWRFYIDDGLATTITGPALYSFETDEQGFRAEGATISRTTEDARTGLSSLAVDVPAGVTTVRVLPPPLPAPHQSIEFWIKLRFDAPAANYGKTTATMLHTAISRERPFFLGEAGIPAQVPGTTDGPAPLSRPECVPKATLSDRAAMFDKMFTKQMDVWHRSSGILAWDWKDPSMLWTDSDGRLVPDKGVSCWSVTPGDPSIDVFRKWADTVHVPPLPQPDPLPPPTMNMTLLKGPPDKVGAGSTFPVIVHVTNGGNAVAGFKVITDGACVGSDKTDAIGFAEYNCKVVSQQGESTVSTHPDPACGCDIPAITKPVLVGRLIRVGAVASVVERGAVAPVRILLSSSDASSLSGTQWTLPDCGTSGIVTENASSVSIPTTCPTSGITVAGSLLLRVQATDVNEIVSGSLFPLLLFDRVYLDPTSSDCVGLAIESGTIGAPEEAGNCTAASFGTTLQWFSFSIPPANRSIAFHPAATKMIVTAAQGGNSSRKIAGLFEYAEGTDRTFAATVTGKNGVPRALTA